MKIFFVQSVKVSKLTFVAATINFFTKLIMKLFVFLEIVNAPVECDNPECGQLYCSYCLNMKMYDKNLQ